MKQITTLLVMALVAVMAFAQGSMSSNHRLLGHTVTDDIDIKGAAVGQAGTYTMGATLDAGVLSAYKGCRVVGVRLAVAMDLGRSRVFLNSIDGRVMNELFSQNQRLYEGWNEIYFNGDGYTIKGDERLFYGFDYVETDEMIKADVGGLACVGQDTEGAFYLYMNGQLNPVSNVGKLCVQLIIDVSNLARDNMLVTSLDYGFKYKKTGEPLELFATVMNAGADPISSYRMAYRIDDRPVEFVDVTDNIVAGGVETWQHVINLPAEIGVGSHSVAVWVDKVNSTTLDHIAALDRKFNFAIYENSMKRNGAYLEVYNDQNSVYASLFNPTLAMVDEDTYVVNVHAPGSPLSCGKSDYLHDLYAYTLPSFTVNRSYFPGEKNIAYDFNDYLGLIDADFIAGILNDLIAQDKEAVSFAGLELKASYDPTSRRLTVDASGDMLPEAEAIYGKMGVTLMVVEDGVKDGQVVLGNDGSGHIDRHYIHDNVLRGYLTSPYGSAVTAKSGAYSASYSMTLPAGWDSSRARVVGILTKAATRVTKDDVRDYDVINVAAVKLSDAAGIDNVEADVAGATVEGYYTLQGVRVDGASLPAGVYVRRYTDGRADKVLVK